MKGREAQERDDAFLPADPAYWSELQDRIVAAGAPTVDRYAGRGWWHLEIGGRAAAVLAACAALAVLGSWTLLPPASVAEPGASDDVLARALLPDDPLAEGLVADEPPSLAAWIGGGEGS